jgi:hypothetical protein
MADESHEAASRRAKTELTLTKSEIAFLNATIELLLEEQRGRTESVTIAVESPAAFLSVLVKGAKALNKVVQKYGGWAALATEVVDAVVGLSPESSRITPEQAKTLERLRAAASRGISLEELLELRDRLEDRGVKQPGTSVTRADV